MKKLFFFCVFFALAVTQGWAGGPIEGQSGKIIFGWNLKIGGVKDINFMPDNSQFILTTQTDIQIRNSATGELVKTLPKTSEYYSGIAFTPDSTRLILYNGAKIESRNVNDLSIIKSDSLLLGADSLNKSLFLFLQGIVVDPIRPYLYVITEKTNNSGTSPYNKRKISVYNYETMQKVNEITKSDEESIGIKYIAISKDGKYLAALNSNDINTFWIKSKEIYLKVWDLNTMKEILSNKLCGDYGNENVGSPQCLKFSELNTDNIYFSGKFPQNKNDVYHNGLFEYSIQSNKIIDSTFKDITGGNFTFFDNEYRLMHSYGGGGILKFINLINKEIELTLNCIDIDTINMSTIIYSKINKYLIGFTSEKCSMIQYNSQTGINENEPIIQTLFPNPTTNTVIINYNCNAQKVNYKILSYNGQSLIDSTTQNTNNILQLDFTKYAAGIYFVQLFCDSEIITYKLIKE